MSGMCQMWSTLMSSIVSWSNVVWSNKDWSFTYRLSAAGGLDVFSLIEYIIWHHSCKVSWFMDNAFKRWVSGAMVVTNTDRMRVRLIFLDAYLCHRWLTASSHIMLASMTWCMDDCFSVVQCDRLRRLVIWSDTNEKQSIALYSIMGTCCRVTEK
jgi:hypothetical protein